MNTIDKFIRKCTPKERKALADLLARILQGDLKDLDLKKLKGYDNYFRVRKGDMRVIFFLTAHGEPVIEKIERKNDKTYKL